MRSTWWSRAGGKDLARVGHSDLEPRGLGFITCSAMAVQLVARMPPPAGSPTYCTVPLIPGIPTSILVAPDSFKGTLSAGQVAEAIGAGLRGAGAQVDLCPVADGGEGTLEALMATLDIVHARREGVRPIGARDRGDVWTEPRAAWRRSSAIVEVAAAVASV